MADESKYRIVEGNDKMICVHGLRFADECAECKSILTRAEAYWKLGALVERLSAGYEAIENDLPRVK